MSDHVVRLRSFVGTEMLHLPSVAVICRDHDGRVLLVRESDSGAWSTPGGAIEPGESPEEAVHREIREEAGVDVRIDELVTAVGGPEFHKTYSNGDRLSFVSLIYRATVIGGDPEPDGDETVEVGWFLPSQVSALPHEPFLGHLLRRGILD